jgi:pimeloyl-ACP methyl ester carboxylesterase
VSRTAGAPDWYVEALAAVPVDSTLPVDDVTIAYRSWGSPGRPPLVLIHGAAAHSRWWDHIGPQLADEFHVLALDLSGHGDSDRRLSYSINAWSDEVLALIDIGATGSPPVVIGHSMGGFVALSSAGKSVALSGVMIIDTPLLEMSSGLHTSRAAQAAATVRPYAMQADAVERFKLIPDNVGVPPYILRHIAAESFRPVDGGWVRKSDPKIFAHYDDEPTLFGGVRCRVALIRPEHGVLSPDMVRAARQRIGPDSMVVEIPHGGHHVLLDQPQALVATIRSVLTGWASEAA